MTEKLQRFDEENGGETFVNLEAKPTLPVVRAGKNFREVSPSGASASTMSETLKQNEIGTLDE
jgi:hypothetical protein